MLHLLSSLSYVYPGCCGVSEFPEMGNFAFRSHVWDVVEGRVPPLVCCFRLNLWGDNALL